MLSRRKGSSKTLSEDELTSDTRKKKGTKKRNCSIICLVICLIIAFIIIYNLPKYIRNRNPHYSLPGKTKTIDTIEAAHDQEIIRTLRYGNIRTIERYGAGLAEKFVCVFETGHQALIKPMEEWHYFERVLPVWDSLKLPEFDNNRVSRAENMYQGWSEVMGFYLDRALGWNKKPPITGRYISNKVNTLKH
jgi:hypothetical protein